LGMELRGQFLDGHWRIAAEFDQQFIGNDVILRLLDKGLRGRAGHGAENQQLRDTIRRLFGKIELSKKPPQRLGFWQIAEFDRDVGLQPRFIGNFPAGRARNPLHGLQEGAMGEIRIHHAFLAMPDERIGGVGAQAKHGQSAQRDQQSESLRHLARRIWRKVSKALRMLVALSALAMFGLRAHAANSLVWHRQKGVVDADLSHCTLLQAMQRISRATGWKIAYEPGLEADVSIKFSNLPETEALRRLLGKFNFAKETTNGVTELLVFRTVP